MAGASERSFANRVSRAMLHPLPIASAVAAVIAGIITPVLAIAPALLWGVAVVALAVRSAAQPPSARVSHLPPSIQADLLAVTTALDELQDAARSVPSEQRPMFEGIEGEAEQLRASVIDLALKAGAVHRHLEATRPQDAASAEEDGRRKRLLEHLQSYRRTFRSLEATATELADRAIDLAAGAPMGYDALDDKSPERRISEMKASMAAIEEVMRTETETLEE